MEYQVLLFLHVLVSTLILGGLFIGSIIVIPAANKSGHADFAYKYIASFGKWTHALLTVQLLTGFRLAMIYVPITEWFGFGSSLSVTVVLKLVLWVALFAWLIVGKVKGMASGEKGSIKSASTYYAVASILGFVLMILGLNFKLGLF